MPFSSVRGQDKAVGRLRSLAETGRVPPALIFHGPPGTGKFLAALEFAAALNCTRIPHVEPEAAERAPENPEEEIGGLFAAPEPAPAEKKAPPAPPPPVETAPGDSCGVCRSCLQLRSGAHPDVRVVDTVFQAAFLNEPESANLKVETARELIRWTLQRPMMSERKVYIVRDAEALVPAAQNALLKTLEDPPDNTVLILVTSRKKDLLPTILSRCSALDFAPLPRQVLGELLAARGADPAEAGRLAVLARGSMEKAAEAAGILQRLSRLRPGDPARAFKFAAGLPRDSHAAREEVKTLLELALERGRRAWAQAAPPAKRRYTEMLRSIMALRRMADRNVSYSLLLQSALLEGERAGLRLEDLLGGA